MGIGPGSIDADSYFKSNELSKLDRSHVGEEFSLAEVKGFLSSNT